MARLQAAIGRYVLANGPVALEEILLQFDAPSRSVLAALWQLLDRSVVLVTTDQRFDRIRSP